MRRADDVHENVALVQRLLDAGFGQGFEAAVEYLDARVEVDWSRSDGPFSDTYAGHDGFRQLFGSFQDVFEKSRIEAHEFIAAGPHVVVPNTIYFRGRHGAEVVARATYVFTVSRRKVVSIRLFQDRADALEAVRVVE